MSSPAWHRRRRKQAWKNLTRKLRRAPMGTEVMVRSGGMTMTAVIRPRDPDIDAEMLDDGWELDE